MMQYTLPPAVVKFDSAAIPQDRRFGRGLFSGAGYRPSVREEQERLALLIAAESRELEDRYHACRFEDLAAGIEVGDGRYTEADALAAGLAV